MLTDNEIKKALECCAGKDGERFCWDCPCKNAETVKEYCDYKMLKSALDLINRLEAENERLKNRFMDMERSCHNERTNGVS